MMGLIRLLIIFTAVLASGEKVATKVVPSPGAVPPAISNAPEQVHISYAVSAFHTSHEILKIFKYLIQSTNSNSDMYVF